MKNWIKNKIKWKAWKIGFCVNCNFYFSLSWNRFVRPREPCRVANTCPLSWKLNEKQSLGVILFSRTKKKHLKEVNGFFLTDRSLFNFSVNATLNVVAKTQKKNDYILCFNKLTAVGSLTCPLSRDSISNITRRGQDRLPELAQCDSNTVSCAVALVSHRLINQSINRFFR